MYHEEFFPPKTYLGNLSNLVPVALPRSSQCAMSSSLNSVGIMQPILQMIKVEFRVETVTEPGGGKATSDSPAQAGFPPPSSLLGHRLQTDV